jgi:hypothetical protein
MMSEQSLFADAPEWRVGSVAYVRLGGTAFCGYTAAVGDDTIVVAIAKPDGTLGRDLDALAWKEFPAESVDLDVTGALVKVPLTAVAKSRPLSWTPVQRFAAPPSQEGLVEAATLALREDSAEDVSSAAEGVTVGLRRVARLAATGTAFANGAVRTPHVARATFATYAAGGDAGDGEDDFDDGGERDDIDLGALHSLLRGTGGAERAGQREQRPYDRGQPPSSSGAPMGPPAAPRGPFPFGAEHGNGLDAPSLAGLHGMLNSSRGPSTAVLNQYMQLLTLNELQKLSKRRNADSDDDDSGGSDQRPRRGVAVPFKRMRKRRAMLKTSKGQRSIRSKYRLQTVQDLDAEEKDKWRYPELFDVMDFSKCKAMGRATWILLHVVQAADRFETADAPAAVAIQGIKALHQYALDTNDWRLAWQMTGLKDPIREAPLRRRRGRVRGHRRLCGSGGASSDEGAEDDSGRGRGRRRPRRRQEQEERQDHRRRLATCSLKCDGCGVRRCCRMQGEHTANSGENLVTLPLLPSYFYQP